VVQFEIGTVGQGVVEVLAKECEMVQHHQQGGTLLKVRADLEVSHLHARGAKGEHQEKTMVLTAQPRSGYELRMPVTTHLDGEMEQNEGLHLHPETQMMLETAIVVGIQAEWTAPAPLMHKYEGAQETLILLILGTTQGLAHAKGRVEEVKETALGLETKIWMMMVI